MINKKGEHVDWIISIGIFLIYLLGMFVIIKPGIIPLHNYNTLLDIADEHLRSDIILPDENGFKFGGLYWTLYKVPFFFQGFKPGGQSGTCIKIDFPYEASEDKINVYRMEDDNNDGIKETLVPLNIILSGSTLYFEELNGASWSTGGEYLIFFSNSAIYDKELVSEAGFNKFSWGIVDTGGCIDNAEGDNFVYNLGINEKIRGVSEATLGLLRDTDPNTYEKIKEIYTYPKSKEFSILITSEDITYDYKIRDPGVKTNIYTRQWGDFILNYDGTRKPVQISVKVW